MRSACALLVCALAAPGVRGVPIDLRIHWIEPAYVSISTGGSVEVSGLGFDSTLVASIDDVPLPASSVQLLSPTRLRLALPAVASPRISTLKLVRTLDTTNTQTAVKSGGIFYTGPYTDPVTLITRPEVFYVRPAPDGNDTNSGTSPAAAKATINAAINAAMGSNDNSPVPAPAQIRVAAGTYAENVMVPRGAVILGGYSADFTQRDPDRFICVIDGMRNNLSAVRTSGSTENFCLIDGFTLTNSRRTGAGGAFRSYTGAPTLTHNVLIGNVASKRGGGAYVRLGAAFDSSVTLAQNLIVGNRAQELSGGGVILYTYYYTNLANVNAALTDNFIVGNRAVLSGGGVAIGTSLYYSQDRLSVSLAHNRIQLNSAENGGALALYSQLHTQFSVRAHDNLMLGNAAADRGGAVYFEGEGGGDFLVTSSTLASNSASQGGALYRAIPLHTSSQLTALIDDILWGNTGGDLGDPEGQVAVHYTDSTDDLHLRGAGDFSLDPRFVAGPLATFYLDPASPALDAGSDLTTARGLSERTTLASQALDTARLDLGFHFPVISVPVVTTPQLLHLVPAYGNFQGGDWVLLRGSGFDPAARVVFDGTDAVRTVFVAANRLLAQPPPRALVGSFTLANVQVLNPGGLASPQTLSYRYVDTDPPEWDSTPGAISADSPSEATPAIIVRWNPALDAVSSPVKYNVHRVLNSSSSSQLIIPQTTNLIASGLTGTSYVDRAFVNRDVNASFVYRVRALDSAFFPNEEMNLTRVFGTVRVGTNLARPDPAVYLLGPRQATSGDTLTLELLVSNQGSANSASLTLTLTLPADVAYLPGTTRRDGVSVADNLTGTPFPLDTPGFTIPNLAFSTSTRLSFQVRVSGTGGLLSWVGVVSTTESEIRTDNNRSERYLNVVPNPGGDIAVTKTGPATATPGSIVTYSLRVANNGTSNMLAVILNDTLPATGLTYVPGSTRRDGLPIPDGASGTPFPLDEAGLALGTFTGGDFTIIEFSASLTATSGSVTNQASVTSTSTDLNTANNSSSVTTRVPTADVAVAKTALVGVVSGKDFLYTLDVSVPAASDGKATSVTVADVLPAGVTYRAGTTLRDGVPVPDAASGTPFPLDEGGLNLGDLIVGASTRVQFTVSVTLASGSLTNQASVSARETDPSSANNSAQAGTTVVAAGAALAPVGNTLSVDPATGGLSWSPAAGAAVYFVHRASAASAYASGTATRLNPLGTLSTSYADPQSPAPSQALFYRVNAGDGAAETDELNMADLEVRKRGPASALDGSVSTYTIEARNIGARDALSAVLTDTLPTEAIYVAGSTRRDGVGIPDDASGTPFPLDGAGLALGTRPGISLTTISFDVTWSGRNVSVTNRATVSTPTPEHTLANDADEVSTALLVPPQADLNLAKTASPDPVTGGGSTLHYSLALRNDGNLAADNVTLTDTLPSGVTFLSATPAPASVSGATLQFALGSLAASNAAPGGPDETSVSIDVRVDMLSGSLANSASVATSTYEENLANNSAQLSTTVQAPPMADLALTKQAPASVGAGARFTYTLSLSNTGNLDAASTTLVDTLPAGATYVAGSTTRDGAGVPDNTSGTAFPIDGSGLSLATLGAGSSTQVKFDVTAPASATTLTNTASASTTSLETHLADNQASAATQALLQADVSIVKTGPATAAKGSTFMYTLTVSNAGPSAAGAVTVIDTLPSGLTYVAGSTRLNGATQPDGITSASGLNIGNLNSGATATVTFQVKASQQTGTRVNQASVSSPTADPNTTNNSSSFTTTIQ